MGKHKSIRFLGLEWNIVSFIIFILGIIGFIIGLIIILFFSPIKLDFLGVIISIAGLITSLAAASKTQLETIRKEIAQNMEKLYGKPASIEKILKEIRDTLRKPEK